MSERERTPSAACLLFSGEREACRPVTEGNMSKHPKREPSGGDVVDGVDVADGG